MLTLTELQKVDIPQYLAVRTNGQNGLSSVDSQHAQLSNELLQEMYGYWPPVNSTLPQSTVSNITVPQNTIPQSTVSNNTLPQNTIPQSTVSNNTLPQNTTTINSE